jgi:Tfp pilus assembly protein PilN
MSAQQDISFLPDGYLERKARRRSNIVCGSLLIAVLGGVGLTWTITRASVRKFEVEHAAVEREYAEAAKKIDQVRAMQAQQQTVARQAELTAALLEKVPRSFILAEITRSLPDGTSLLDFTLESKARANTAAASSSSNSAAASSANKLDATKASPGDGDPQPKLYDVTMKLTGIAYTDTQVAQLIARLGRSKLFTDVNLLVTDEYGSSEPKMRKFQIEMTLNPAANVTADGKRLKSETVSLDR